MKLMISKDVASKYPDLAIGIVLARGVTNTKSNEVLTAMLREAEENLRQSQWSSETLVEHPYIAAWRDIYLSFGVKSKSVRKDPPTAENTIRYVLEGNSLREINSVVNAYLMVELECFLPIGGYDLDKIEGDIVLKTASGGEPFMPISGDKRLTKQGEVVYCDDQRVLTYRWNKMDCGETQITVDTNNLILCIESADKRISKPALEMATKRLKDILMQFCPGEYEALVVDASEGQTVELG